MSIMERITDAPIEPRAYLDYAIEAVRGRIEYWKSLAPDGKWWDTDADKTVACVVANLDHALFYLEEYKHKLANWPRDGR